MNHELHRKTASVLQVQAAEVHPAPQGDYDYACTFEDPTDGPDGGQFASVSGSGASELFERTARREGSPQSRKRSQNPGRSSGAAWYEIEAREKLENETKLIANHRKLAETLEARVSSTQ